QQNGQADARRDWRAPLGADPQIPFLGARPRKTTNKVIYISPQNTDSYPCSCRVLVQADRKCPRCAMQLPLPPPHDVEDVELRLLDLWKRQIDEDRNRNKKMLDARSRPNTTTNGNGAAHDDGATPLTDDQLFRATRDAVAGADRAVFGTMAGMIR